MSLYSSFFWSTNATTSNIPPSISGLDCWSNPPPPQKKNIQNKIKNSTINISQSSPFPKIYNPPHTHTPCPYYPHFSFCRSTFPFLSNFFFSEWHKLRPLLPVFCLLFRLSTPPPYFYRWLRFYPPRPFRQYLLPRPLPYIGVDSLWTY